MTTIVALQGDGFAVVAHDSRVSDLDSSGHIAQVITVRQNASKVAKNGKYLLGAAGDMRAINILHHVFAPPTPPSTATGVKLDKFFTSKFIPDLRECFEAQGYAAPERDSSDHLAEHSSLILVVIHGVIYVVDGTYSWASDINGMYAIGTGSPYALGALKALMPKNKLSPTQAKRMALKALNVSAHYDPHTGGPFIAHIQEH